jgi:hypothetical protein
MKLARTFLAITLCFSLSFLTFLSIPTQTVSAQDSKIALQRGFRTGYSDGYMAGYRDSIENAARSYSRHQEYGKADRAYNKDYGAINDYRDGYQQGFESGYNTGFEKRAFEANLPSSLSKRGVVAVTTDEPSTVNRPSENTTAGTAGSDQGVSDSDARGNDNQQRPTIKDRTNEVKYAPGDTDNAIILIPTDTELIVELQDDLNTERSREGDRFTAKVVSPAEIAGAMVEGRVSKVTKPGRLKRRAELLLSFDRILLNENRWSNMSAIMTEVLPVKGDNVKKVDTEGTALGKRSYKEDAIKVGGATGAGLVTGAVIAGPVGAGVGAAMGAAFGVGAVVVERGKHIKLNKNQQLRVKTAYETQIR